MHDTIEQATIAAHLAEIADLKTERDEQADTIDQLSVQYTDALVERDAAREIAEQLVVKGCCNPSCSHWAGKMCDCGLQDAKAAFFRTEQPTDTAEGEG